MHCTARMKNTFEYKELIDKGLSEDLISRLGKQGYGITEIYNGEWKPGEWKTVNAKLQWIEKTWIPKDTKYIKLGT